MTSTDSQIAHLKNMLKVIKQMSVDPFRPEKKKKDDVEVDVLVVPEPKSESRKEKLAKFAKKED